MSSGVHGFWTKSSRISDAAWLTDIGERARMTAYFPPLPHSHDHVLAAFLSTVLVAFGAILFFGFLGVVTIGWVVALAISSLAFVSSATACVRSPLLAYARPRFS